MLERDQLRIELPDAEQARAIRALPDDETLGAASLAAAQGWLSGPALRVREGEDESLLFTVRRAWRWSRRWTVRDADDRLVGKVHARTLANTRGQVIARHERFQSAQAGCFIGIEGKQLASWQRRDGGELDLRFAAIPECHPFTRMLVLGAALVLDRA